MSAVITGIVVAIVIPIRVRLAPSLDIAKLCFGATSAGKTKRCQRRAVVVRRVALIRRSRSRTRMWKTAAVTDRHYARAVSGFDLLFPSVNRVLPDAAPRIGVTLHHKVALKGQHDGISRGAAPTNA